MTFRSVVLALGLVFLSVLWIRQVELLRFTCQITESIPPIPAIAAYNILRNRVARLVLEVGILSEGLMGRFSNVGPGAGGAKKT